MILLRVLKAYLEELMIPLRIWWLPWGFHEFLEHVLIPLDAESFPWGVDDFLKGFGDFLKDLRFDDFPIEFEGLSLRI